jgi:hypothetical protein
MAKFSEGDMVSVKQNGQVVFANFLRYLPDTDDAKGRVQVRPITGGDVVTTFEQALNLERAASFFIEEA